MGILMRKGGIGDVLPLDRRLLMGDPKPVSKAALAPLHTRTDRPLRCVLGGCDTLDLHEGPPRLVTLQHRTACPFGCGHTTRAARFQEASHLLAKRAHIRPTGAPVPARRRHSPLSPLHGL